MRKTLLFIFLLFAEIASAQNTQKAITPVLPSGTTKQFTGTKTNSGLAKPVWDEAEPYVNNYARVLLNNKFSFINLSGDLISPIEFDAARNFSNKLSAVRKGNKWGFINESGKQAIPFQYEIVFDFKEPVTGVYSEGKWFLINTNGAIIKPLNITVFYGFNHGIAAIEKDGRKGTMNTIGEISLNKEEIKTPESGRLLNGPVLSNSNATDCPENIDFEFGSFLNWKCFIGRVDSIGSTNVITVNPSAPTNNRHTLFPRVLPSAIDPFGLFPTNPPDGSNFAVRLGNTNIGAQAERIQYPIHVPINDSNFSIKYDYAVVFEDPGHTIWTQPRFTVRLLDSATNTYVDCASFEYISTSNLPGFARSTVDTGVVYKPWSSVFVSMRGYAGKTMYLEFTTADCVRRGHWGYAYLDVEKPCGQSIQLQYECNSPNITTLGAPPGFQIYNWWDSTFTTLYGTGQNVVLNPGPRVNTIIWLEMIPFNNFGCKDTIPVKITGVFNANFSMSDTVAVCAPHAFTFYNSDVPSATAIWDFGDGTTGSGDTVTHIYTLPGTYNVTLTVVLQGGCTGTVVKTVTILQPVGNFSFNSTYYCNDQRVRFDAVVNNADSLFWNFGDGTQLATTQTTVFHSYALPGLYLPFLTVQSTGGCRNTQPGPDTIRIDKLIAGFFETQQHFCGSTLVTFTDTSFAFSGAGTYQWNFGDGTTANGHTVNHTYTTSGTYNVQLILTALSGCKDTVIKPITVVVYKSPVAAITGLNIQCNNVAVTFNSVIQSGDTINYIHWTASNGSAGSGNTFTVNFNLAGNYTIQLIVGTIHGCYDTATHLITINPTPDVLQPANQVLCNGSLTNAVNFTGAVNGTLYNWTNNNTSIGLAANGTGDIASFTAINNSTSPVTATITVSPVANNCPGISKTFTITVNPSTDLAQPVNQVLCHNTTTAAINFTGPVSGTIYNWTNDNTSIGLAAAGLGNISPFTAINNSGAPITATITVNSIANGCSGPVKTFTITVNPTPDVLQPANQVLCNGALTNAINFTGAVNGTLYNWTNNNTSIGLAANGTGDIASFTAINTSTSPVTATFTVSPVANNCPGISKTFTITVNPSTDLAQPVNQVLCNNTTTAAINFSGPVNGTIYNWANDNTSIGLAAAGLGNISPFTAINNSGAPITATITVNSIANGCSGPVKTFTITVNPTPDVLQPVNQVLCNGALTNAINFTGTVNGTLYNWTNNNTSIGLAANGTGDIASFTAINNSTSPVTATITVSHVANNCPGISKTFTITVNPSTDLVQPVNQVLCHNTTTAAINFTGPVSGTSYNWTNDNTSIGLAAAGSGNISPFTAINNSGAPITATITVNSIANGCSGPVKSFTITVNPTPDVLQPANQVLCNGSLTNAVNFTGAVNGTLYNWTNNNTSIGLAANGTGDIASFTAINNSTSPVTATITVSPVANNCPGISKTFTITVNPIPDLAQPNNQALCSNELTIPILFNGSVSGTIYNWANNITQIGLAANGLGDIPSFTALNNGTSTITATITVSANANGCSSPVKVFTIAVNPVPDVDQPNDQVLCNGAFTTAIIFTGAINGTSFNWTNDQPAIGLSANGSGNIPAFTAINNSNAPITATITVSPSTTNCPGVSKTFTITVNPSTDVDQPGNQVLCKNEPTTAIVFNGPVSGTIYNWTNDNTLIGLAANGSGDIPSFTAINNTTQPVTATITVIASANGCSSPAKQFTITVNPLPVITQPADLVYCNGATTNTISFATAVSGAAFNWINDNPSIGLASSGIGNIAPFNTINNTSSPVVANITVSIVANGCPGIPKTFTITINPTADITQPNDQVLCNGSLTASINFTGTVTGNLYNWFNNNTSIGLGATGTGDIAAFTATNNSIIPVTATITVTPTANGCMGPINTFTITVNPTADVNQPQNQVLCNESTSAEVNFTGNVSNTSFNWTNNNTAIGLGAGGTGNISPFTVINTTHVPVTATITVIPTSAGCPGPAKTFTITVNPTANVIQPSDQTLCNGSSTDAVIFGGAVNGTVYNWSNNNTSIGLVANGNGNIASFTAVNDSNTVSTALITVTPTANNCPGLPKDFMIVVKTSPVVIPPNDQTLCNRSLTAPITFIATVNGATVSWTNNNTSIGLAANGTGNIPAFQALNTTDGAIIALINATAVANGCTGPVKRVILTVNPTPKIVASNNMNVCLGRNVQLSATGGAQYSWRPANLLSCTNCANPVSTPVDSIRYIVQGTSAEGCIAYDSVLLNVIKPFRMRVGPGDSLCLGESTGLKAMYANTYLWSPPAGLNNVYIPEPMATPQVTTTYTVIGYDGHNCFTDTGHVTIVVGPKPTVEIGPDISTQTGTTVTLHPTTQNGPIVSWLWTPATNLSCTDCPAPVASVANDITYTVTVKNIHGCIATDRIRLNVFCKSAQVFIPNAFTPDADGLNDVLMIRGSGISVKSFRIFNRWGELVFEKTNFSANDPKFGWDGKVRGVLATPDVFVYTAEVICDNGITYIYKGNTTVLK